MRTYHKIQSIFKRDPASNHKTFLMGQWSVPAFGLLKDLEWAFTEKVDGTNIRIGWDDVTKSVTFGGKSDNAQIPGQLATYMAETFTPEFLGERLDGPLTLFGEGYGGKIQNGSGYQIEQRFILFDAYVEPTSDHPLGIWLERETVEAIAKSLEIPVAPVLYSGPLETGLIYVQSQPVSTISTVTMVMEGIVARPKVELFDRLNHRIITKIKVKDFPV